MKQDKRLAATAESSTITRPILDFSKLGLPPAFQF